MHHPLTGLYANALFNKLRNRRRWPVVRVRVDVGLTDLVCFVYVARSAWVALGLLHLLVWWQTTRLATKLARSLRIPVRARVVVR